MGEIRTEIENNLVNFCFVTKINSELKILSRTARPGMVGEITVTVVINYTVDSITCIEAWCLSGNEVCISVGE